MVEEKKPASKIRPGDKVIRKQRNRARRLKIAPNVPSTIKVIKFILQQTPFVPMFGLFVVLWLIFAAFFFLAEHQVNPDVSSYGQALWWGMATVETMGTPYKPLTTVGEVVGGIWAVMGVMLFWGAIIASVTAYFAKRKEGTVKQIVSTLEYNLEHMDDLSIEELKLLKETAASVIDTQIEMSKYQGRGGLDK